MCIDHVLDNSRLLLPIRVVAMRASQSSWCARSLHSALPPQVWLHPIQSNSGRESDRVQAPLLLVARESGARSISECIFDCDKRRFWNRSISPGPRKRNARYGQTSSPGRSSTPDLPACGVRCHRDQLIIACTYGICHATLQDSRA